MPDEPLEMLPTRKLTQEEQFYLEQARKEPIECLQRIEETAKFLIGAVATASGLFLGALKLAFGGQAAPDASHVPPVVCWAFSIAALLCVLLPDEYQTVRNSPGALRQVILQARRKKYRWLIAGVVLFLLGLFAGLVPLWKG